MQVDQNIEIDLFSYFKTIWDGKWKIIITTLFATTFGYIYILTTPNLYEVTSPIINNNQNVFIKYKSLNDTLKESKQFLYYEESKPFEIDGNIIIEMFVTEFNDYEEMINVLSKSEFVQNKVQNLSNIEKRKTLVKLANKFKIVNNYKTNITKDNDFNREIIFRWHDKDEGILLIDKALKLTLINVQNKLSMNVKSLASSLEKQIQRQITSFKSQLSITREIYELSTAKKKLYLIEQSKIAKELGIENNTFDLSLLKQKSPLNCVLPQPQILEKFDNQYYLRGFKAIDKEIQLLNARSEKDKDLMADEYLKIKKKLLLAESDNKPNELRDAVKIIVNDDIKNWINFNLEFSEVKNLKKSSLIISFSIIIGLMIGIFGVFILNSIKERKN